MQETMLVLDYYKDHYAAPIVVMSQLKDPSESNPLNFQNRIEGYKGIFQPATVVLELIPNRELLQSKWRIWKNRYKGGTVGGWKDVAYDKGMFKSLTEEWKAYGNRRKESKEYQNTIGKHVDEKRRNKGVIMYTRETINELNALSRAVFGTTSKWRKMIDSGVPELVEENTTKLTVENGKEQKETVKTAKLYTGPNGDAEIHQSTLKHYTVSEVREFMLMVLDRRKQMQDTINRLEAENNAQDAAKRVAEKASGSSI